MITWYECERCHYKTEMHNMFLSITMDNGVEVFDESDNLCTTYCFCSRCMTEIRNFIEAPLKSQNSN